MFATKGCNDSTKKKGFASACRVRESTHAEKTSTRRKKLTCRACEEYVFAVGDEFKDSVLLVVEGNMLG